MMTSASVATPLRPPALVYALPCVHLLAFLVFAAQNWEWKWMVIVDLPVSLLLLGLSWRWDNPLLWCVVLGTLWWYFLSRRNNRYGLEVSTPNAPLIYEW